MMITQVLQPEFSAAIAGIKTPDEALGSAQKQIAHILGARPMKEIRSGNWFVAPALALLCLVTIYPVVYAV